MNMGIQLYSVRDALAADFAGTLRAIAEMGFDSVEFAFTFGDMTPDDLPTFLKGLGLTCCGVHTGIPQLLDPNSEAYAYVKSLDIPFVTTGCADKVAEGLWQETVAQLIEVGRTAKDQGACFTYHNHHQEFAEVAGVYALDYLYENTPADVVSAEIDTAWVQRGGAIPQDYIRKYATRTKQIHLKDLDPETGIPVELGRGCVDIPAIFAVANEIGCEWMIYELDESTMGSSLDSTRASIQHLKDSGLI